MTRTNERLSPRSPRKNRSRVYLVAPMERRVLLALHRLVDVGVRTLGGTGRPPSRSEIAARAVVDDVRPVVTSGVEGPPLCRREDPGRARGFLLRGATAHGGVFFQGLIPIGAKWRNKPGRTWVLSADDVPLVAAALIAWMQDPRNPKATAAPSAIAAPFDVARVPIAPGEDGGA